MLNAILVLAQLPWLFCCTLLPAFFAELFSSRALLIWCTPGVTRGRKKKNNSKRYIKRLSPVMINAKVHPFTLLATAIFMALARITSGG